MLVGNREDADLFRRKPSWEGACKMFDQYATKSLHRSERRTMNHHGSAYRIIGCDVPQIESLRQVIVDLYRPQLPFAADDIFDDEINFGTIERSLAGFFHVSYTQRSSRLFQRALCVIPVFGAPHIFRRIR